MKKIFTFISIAALSTACMKENEFDEKYVSNSENAIIEASIDNLQEETRTSLDINDTGTIRVLWSEGDQIAVINQAGVIRKATLVSGAGTADATFAIEGHQDGDTYPKAVYPYQFNLDTKSALAYSTNSLTVNFPEFQVMVPQAGKVFSEATNTMLGTPDAGKLSFKSLFGCIEIKVTGSQRVLGVTLKEPGAKLSGEARINDAGVISFVNSNRSNSFLYLECPSPVQLSGTATSFYFLVPAGTYSHLQVGFMTEDGSYIRTATKPHTVVKNTIHPLNAGNLDAMIDKGSAVNLSEAETANCYIVSPNGGTKTVYSFDTRFVDGTPVVNNEVPGSDKSLAYAQTLWTSDLGIADNICFDKAAGKVYFEYNGTSTGNTRISVSNNFFAAKGINTGSIALTGIMKAKEGICWTWHIWATDEPGRGHAPVANPDNPARRFMDRNLGATYAPKTVSEVNAMTPEQATASAGCFYQYGNMSPYPRQKTLGAAQSSTSWGYVEDIYIYGFSQFAQLLANSSGAKNNAMITYRYPLYLYSAKYIPTVADLDQLKIDLNKPTETLDNIYNNNQWVKADITVSNSTDPAIVEKVLWNGENVKTNSDPCPPGYRVPHRGNLFWSTNSPDALTKFHIFPSDGTTKYGSYYSSDGTSADWYPFSGYLSGTAAKIGNSGGTGYLWGTLYWNNLTKYYNFATYARTISTLNADGNPANSQSYLQPALSIGYQLRCIQN